jgi:dihydrodipicolinate synthase/N-acetylneuraminate lyase
VETNPVPVKELLHRLGLCGREPRLPLATVTAAHAEFLSRFHATTLAALVARDGEDDA